MQVALPCEKLPKTAEIYQHYSAEGVLALLETAPKGL